MQEIDQLKKTNADLLVGLQQAARLLRAAGFAMTGTASSQIMGAINAATICAVPPLGWQCTRTAGHDGPCAAIPAAANAAALPPIPLGISAYQGPDGTTQSSYKAAAADAGGLTDAIRGRIPLVEPVYIGKALRAGREAKPCLAGGTGPVACVMLCNIQLAPWTHTEATAKAFADGYNRGSGDLRAALLEVAEQDRAPATSAAAVPERMVKVMSARGKVGLIPQAAPEPMTPADDWEAVMEEVARATRKFPTWPTDPLHAVAVLGEEFGELTKAVLQTTYEPHKVEDGELRTEAIQTAAMALRFVASLGQYEFTRCAQHSQHTPAAKGAGGQNV